MNASDGVLGNKADSAATNDTDNNGYIGLFKRLLQRVTNLIALLLISLTASGGLRVILKLYSRHKKI